MKAIRVFAIVSMSLLMVFSANAQKDKSERKSPPAQVSKEVNGKKITIDYSQPSKKGREIFGGLEAYGEVWRTGANESTWISFSDNVTIGGKKLATGKYGLFTIPGKDEWTIIFNKKWDGWGTSKYDEDNDVLRIKVKPISMNKVVEVFTIAIEDRGNVMLAWDRTKVKFSVK